MKSNDQKSESSDSSVLADASKGNLQQKQALEITEQARRAYQSPSFGAELFAGHFAPEMLFPFPEQSKEDKLEGDKIIDEFIGYLKTHLDPDEVDVTRTIPQHVINEMKRMGIFALKIPKEYGGLGLSQTNYGRLVMQVASHCSSTAVLISAHQSIGVPQPLKLYGTAEQKRKFLPRFREGSISAFALTEPDVGSDPAQMSSSAELSKDGQHYILNGEKLWCTNGTIADIIVVVAKTAPKIVNGKERKQLTAFILEMDTPGIEIVHRCEFMGLGGIYNGLLRFTNVKIPAENVIWGEGRGLALALGTINVGRLTLPAACTGGAKQCLSIARRWGTSRIQWGMPIGLLEAGREKIAYIASTTFAMEAMTWMTCAWADKGEVDIRIEAAMAKLFCTEAMWKIVDMTMQLRGGRGYEKCGSLKARGEVPYPVERLMRDSRVNTILEGSSEIMKLFLAREAMDSHLKRAGKLLARGTPIFEKTKALFTMVGHYSLWYPKQYLDCMSTKKYSEMGRLAKHFRFIEKSAHRLARRIFEAMVKYRSNLERKQLLLGRLMDIGTDLFAMATTCSYALSLKQHPDLGESPLDLADFFCATAARRIKERFDAIDHNDDKQSNAIAKKTIEKAFRWLENDIVWIGPED